MILQRSEYGCPICGTWYSRPDYALLCAMQGPPDEPSPVRPGDKILVRTDYGEVENEAVEVFVSSLVKRMGFGEEFVVKYPGNTHYWSVKLKETIFVSEKDEQPASCVAAEYVRPLVKGGGA